MSGTLRCLLLTSVLLAACQAPPSVETFSGSTMGTTYAVTVESDTAVAEALSVGALVEAELARIEGAMSTFDSGSDVSRFGAYTGSVPMRVDGDLVRVVVAALQVARLSGGAFDPTVGPLVDAWGFGPSDRPPPDSVTVGRLLRHVGYDRLTADLQRGTLAKSDPGVGIDLSGIAKGFAAEHIALRIRALGYRSALVDVGGELKALGSHVDGRPWRVALEGPGGSAPEIVGTVDLVDEAVATSGDFRNYYEDGGVLFSHIIDPSTGSPIPYRGFSVSVIHPDATFADAWATALSVLGPGEGFEVAEREGLAALYAWREGGEVVTRPTSAMEGRVTSVE